MQPRPDVALEVALDQRQRIMDEAQAALSHHERALQEQLRVLSEAQSRVNMVLLQIDAAQRPVPGAPLPVALLGDLERLLDWCEVQVLVQRDRLDTIRAEAEEARGAPAPAPPGGGAVQVLLRGRHNGRA